MHIIVNKELNCLVLNDLTEQERRQIELSFSVKTKNYWNHPLYKQKVGGKRKWDGSINFFRHGKFIPLGLWKELISVCKRFSFDYNSEFIYEVVDNTIKMEDIEAFCETYFKDNVKKPRYYQKDALFVYAKYKRAICEMATGSGKTLLTYLIHRYFEHVSETKINKTLLIVPNTALITQTYQEWLEEHNVGKPSIKFLLVSGEDTTHKKVDPKDYDVVIGTFQSLAKHKEEFFVSFDTVMVDESHTAGAVSIKNILSKCKNAHYKIGMSGSTMVDVVDADSYGRMEFLGPLLYQYTAKQLIEDGFGTKANIKVMVLNYLSDRNREALYNMLRRKDEDRGKILTLEKTLVVESNKRLNFIVKMLLKMTKNTLVLYSSVEKEYGLKIRDLLRAQQTDKDVYYIEGSTKQDLRQIYKEKMEVGDNVILIASFGTTSTGISINNIHNIFIVESYKSEIIIKQTIGRGLRLLDGKEKVDIYDFVDDYRVYGVVNGERKLKKKKKNILFSHGEERMSIYSSEGHDVKVYKVDLMKKEEE